MTDSENREVFALREAFHKTTAALLTHGHARDILRELEAAGFSLSLLADRARMEKAIELLCEVYEAACDVSMAAVQDDDGEWSIKGDPEAMLGRLYLATEEVRKVTKGASSELRGRDVTVARRYTDDDYQEMRRNLYPKKGVSQ